ncbi:MAG: hypothetical protein LBP93_07545 [Treponema sp.]|nr:hypothetical protein [Treponema sp.]
MRSRVFFLSFVFCMTVLFLVCMAGCGKTVFSGSGLGNDPVARPQVPIPPGSSDPAWYVSSGGNDSGDGFDSSKPLASVQAALARIKSIYRSGKWPAGKSAVIVISGTITGSGSFGSSQSMIDVSGAGNYPPLVFEGDPLRGGVLDAKRDKDNQGRVLYIANNQVTLGSDLILTGGYVLWGGAVCVGTPGSPSEGEFIMAGGEISGNTAGMGGAVLVYKGSMTMSGGIIQNNTNAEYSKAPGSGGGIYLSDYTSLTMSGGTIRDNGGAQTDTGGGVGANGKSLFTMTGGEILNNSSTSQGGGVYVAPYGNFTLSGGTISGNKTGISGGGVYVSKYGAVFTQPGGTISGNTPDEKY